MISREEESHEENEVFLLLEINVDTRIMALEFLPESNIRQRREKKESRWE